MDNKYLKYINNFVETDFKIPNEFKNKNMFGSLKNFHKGLDPETILRGLIQLIPAGGLIEKYLFANKDKNEIKKIYYFLYCYYIQINKIIEDNKNKIDQKYLKTEQFYNLFKQCIEKIRFETEISKIQLFKNFLINASILNNKNIDKEYILSKLDNISLNHFEIIDWYYKYNYIIITGIGSEYDQNKKKIKLKYSYFDSYENDLATIGFLNKINGLGSVERYYLTKLGLDFYNFIKYDDL
ncbi:hypothetical protein GW835_01065 [archaeon]|nr:hypothetical protein [archaeon]NCP79144.1 hypothetical protein [archaeon]NCP97910.1 hypothetical protein [archaeon]NCQ06911.1 hypothetical protein [archaeon]NCQ50707.1 hypothetical protein [archaeon]